MSNVSRPIRWFSIARITTRTCSRISPIVRMCALLSGMNSLDPFFGNDSTTDLLNSTKRISEPILPVCSSICTKTDGIVVRIFVFWRSNRFVFRCFIKRDFNIMWRTTSLAGANSIFLLWDIFSSSSLTFGGYAMSYGWSATVNPVSEVSKHTCFCMLTTKFWHPRLCFMHYLRTIVSQISRWSDCCFPSVWIVSHGDVIWMLLRRSFCLLLHWLLASKTPRSNVLTPFVRVVSIEAGPAPRAMCRIACIVCKSSPLACLSMFKRSGWEYMWYSSLTLTNIAQMCWGCVSNKDAT